MPYDHMGTQLGVEDRADAVAETLIRTEFQAARYGLSVPIAGLPSIEDEAFMAECRRRGDILSREIDRHLAKIETFAELCPTSKT